MTFFSSADMKEQTVISLILSPLRGNFSPAGGGDYEKLKPLKDGPLLHV
jgi:hypothetical protein